MAVLLKKIKLYSKLNYDSLYSMSIYEFLCDLPTCEYWSIVIDISNNDE